MPDSVQAALLGVVQGLTEFLPVSSSAHLILARAFFGFDGDKFGLAFDVACHVGTVLAVLAYYWRDIAWLLASVPAFFSAAPSNLPSQAGAIERGGPRGSASGARFIWLLLAGTMPAVVVGLLFNHAIEEHLRTPAVAATTLAAGALGFFYVERVSSRSRNHGSLSLVEAFWIGCAQALALVPGVSRSGATLTVALLLGLARADAAQFIFLLGVPAILGAAAKEAPKIVAAGVGWDTARLFLIGVLTSTLVGYAAVRFFVGYLGRRSLSLFGWYRLALSAAVVAWIALG
jgi:undecaprenyl-diphosphatase